jgi:release factor glutamine methyltransferase
VPPSEAVGGTTTLGALLDEAAGRLRAAGAPDARRQAALLWSVLAGGTPGDVWLRRDLEPAASVEGPFQALVDRLLAGEPLAYVAGTAGFRTLELTVDRRVLIPRPETEGLVALVLEWGGRTFGDGPWGVAADIGTGSGCIGLSLAVEGRFERIVATDVSDGAIAVASANRDRVGPAVPVEFRRGAFLAPLAGERCTAIVANPPYVAEAELAELTAGVRDHEPPEALVSAEGGLYHVRRLLEEARDHLKPGGVLAVEIDSRRALPVAEHARAAGWRRAAVHRDLYGRDRYLLATKE